MNKEGGGAAYSHILPSIIPPYCIIFQVCISELRSSNSTQKYGPVMPKRDSPPGGDPDPLPDSARRRSRGADPPARDSAEGGGGTC